MNVIRHICFWALFLIATPLMFLVWLANQYTIYCNRKQLSLRNNGGFISKFIVNPIVSLGFLAWNIMDSLWKSIHEK